jgi:hypothetical protein
VATKRVLRYLKGAIGFGMHFVKSSYVNLVGYSDCDWGEGDEEMMSTLSYCFAIGDRIFC